MGMILKLLKFRKLRQVLKGGTVDKAARQIKADIPVWMESPAKIREKISGMPRNLLLFLPGGKVLW